MYLLYAPRNGRQYIIGIAKTQSSLEAFRNHAINAGIQDVTSGECDIVDYPVLVLNEYTHQSNEANSERPVSYDEFKAVAQRLQQDSLTYQGAELTYFDNDWVISQKAEDSASPYYRKHLSNEWLQRDGIPTLLTLEAEKAYQDDNLEKICQLVARLGYDQTITPYERDTLFQCIDRAFDTQLFFRPDFQAAERMLDAMKDSGAFNMPIHQGLYHFALFKNTLKNNGEIDHDNITQAIAEFNKLPSMGYQNMESAEYHFDTIAGYITTEAFSESNDSYALWDLYESLCLTQLKDHSTPYYWTKYLRLLSLTPPVDEIQIRHYSSLYGKDASQELLRRHSNLLKVQHEKLSKVPEPFKASASHDDNILSMLIDFCVKTQDLAELKSSPDHISHATIVALFDYVLLENRPPFSETEQRNIAHTFLDYGKKLKDANYVVKALTIFDKLVCLTEAPPLAIMLERADALMTLASIQEGANKALNSLSDNIGDYSDYLSNYPDSPSNYLRASEQLAELINHARKEHHLFGTLIKRYENIYLTNPTSHAYCLHYIDQLLNIHDEIAGNSYIINPHLVRLRLSLYNLDLATAMRYAVLSLLHYRHGCDQETRNLIKKACDAVGDTSLHSFAESETAFVNKNHNKIKSNSNVELLALANLPTEQLLEKWEAQKQAIVAQPVTMGW